MDKLKTLILVIFLFFSAGVFAQNPAKIIKYDFGKVKPNTQTQAQLKTEEDIVSLASLCECIKAKVEEKDDLTLINIEFDSTGYQGQVQETVFMVNQKNQLIKLKIKALVE